MDTDIDLSNSSASCGWFNVKTGESGTFVSKQEISNYNSLPWYKRLFRSKPVDKIVQSNPFFPPEFCQSFGYTQNWLERSWLQPSRSFETHGVLNVYIERNRYSESYNRFFYEEGGERIYLDPKALKQGQLAKLISE